ncbi:MAG: phosphoribosylaminoimidazolesuccinocarboxamide synthase [Anaerolineae bacterium]
MLDHETLKTMIPHALRSLDLDWPYDRKSGKVRESFMLPDDRRLLVTTDRLSAFDVVLAALPYKGQVLNQLSAFWFERTADVVPSHLLEVVDPSVSLVRECEPLPVEVIVRGSITGSTKTSLWTLYASGHREIYGHTFPDGLQKNDPLPKPIITPTTKAGPGEHDERLTCDEVVTRGFLEARTWETVQDAALAIFERGQTIAQAAGFCLVDTKYEFGRGTDGALMLIDEVHTPDSSRFWRADTMDEPQPDQWDKEYVRLWYAEQNYRGDGTPPELPADVIAEAARRYIGLYEGLSGQTFEPGDYPADPRIQAVLRSYLG